MLLAPPPVHLPSRRSENSGTSIPHSHILISHLGLDPNINIVPTGGSGWGSVKPTDTSSHPPPPTSETKPEPVIEPKVEEPTPSVTTTTTTPSPATSAWSGPNKLIEKTDNSSEYDRRGFKLAREEFPTLGKEEKSPPPATSSSQANLRPQHQQQQQQRKIL